jgi:hypothetical protein
MANTTCEIQANDAASEASVTKVDMKLEIVVIPVSDVDRAKEFYARLGWRLDADSLPRFHLPVGASLKIWPRRYFFLPRTIPPTSTRSS